VGTKIIYEKSISCLCGNGKIKKIVLDYNNTKIEHVDILCPVCRERVHIEKMSCVKGNGLEEIRYYLMNNTDTLNPRLTYQVLEEFIVANYTFQELVKANRSLQESKNEEILKKKKHIKPIYESVKDDCDFKSFKSMISKLLDVYNMYPNNKNNLLVFQKDTLSRSIELQF
jgi:hypothetical protein